MIIRKVKKSDLNDYLTLCRKNYVEYDDIVGEKIKFEEKLIIKNFNDCVNNQKRFLLVMENDNHIIGYLMGRRIKSDWEDYGYLDDIFIQRNFRKNNFGTKLMNEFVKILKNKNVRKIRLDVNIKNVNAKKMYEKFGFGIKQYRMDKQI